MELLVGNAPYCDYKTIQSAFDALKGLKESVTIRVLAGTYPEDLKLYHSDVKLIGLGKVVITGKHYAREKLASGKERTTFQTATFFVNAEKVVLENLTIENTAGSGKGIGQAVALYLEGTDIFCKNCRLLAKQDTLCLGPLPEKNGDGTIMESPFRKVKYPEQKTYFKCCYLTGDVDFIFGGGEGHFSQCEIVPLKRDSNTPSYICAPATPKGQGGFSFEDCFIHSQGPYYLGRPWRKYAATTFKNCYFDKYLEEAKWSDWNHDVSRRATTRFETIDNYYYES